MQTFRCSECGQLLFFENTGCIRCGLALGYSAEEGELLTLKPSTIGTPSDLVYSNAAESESPSEYRLCLNRSRHNACNWVVPHSNPHEYCLSCRLTEVLPPLSDEKKRKQWVGVEAAKRRLIYTLLELGLPVRTRAEDPKLGLAFRFEGSVDQNPVLTGHANGVITLNMAEADAAFRENAREKMGEAYRTVLGHLRHESGHYYWQLLLLPSEHLAQAREIFGDDQMSYQDAVTAHYENGAPADWNERYISSYATMHPWEDWAETWAHYLHMIDTLETAESYDLAVRSPSTRGDPRLARPSLRHRQDFDELFDDWYSLTFVLNGLSRSMGMPDAYPFVISETVREKIRFVHDFVTARSEQVRVKAA